MRKRALAMCLAVAAAMLAGCGTVEEEEKTDYTKFPFYNAEYQTLAYSGEDYLKNISRPYWLGNVMYNELTLPISYENGDAYAKLLYKPLKIVSVMDQKLEKTYAEGTDYTLDAATGRLVIPANSSIELLSEKAETGKKIPDGYELSGSPDHINKYTVWDLGSGPFVYTESSLFYGRYLSVTYAYDMETLPTDVFVKYDATVLTDVRAKLKAKDDFSIAVIGDSISAGSSSTGDNLHVAPNTPCYANQIKTELQNIYGSKVTLTNSAVGGTKSEYPLTGEGSGSLAKAIAADPDLCVIAYGMNDSTDSVSAFAYASNIRDIISRIRTSSPDCEFILVNSFPCNPLYERTVGIFDKYLTKLKEIEAEYEDGSVRVVDMQKPGKYFLETKRFCEISSSNVNHPNDFMHRVYAMNIVSAISDYKTK